MMEGHGKSSIAPLFQSRAVIISTTGHDLMLGITSRGYYHITVSHETFCVKWDPEIWEFPSDQATVVIMCLL